MAKRLAFGEIGIAILVPGEAVAPWPLAVVVCAALLVVVTALIVAADVVLAAVVLAVVLTGVLAAALAVVLDAALLAVLVAALLVVLVATVVEPVLPVVAVELPQAAKRIVPSSNTPIHQRRLVVLSQITSYLLHCLCGWKWSQVALSCRYRAPILCHHIVKQSSRVRVRRR